MSATVHSDAAPAVPRRSRARRIGRFFALVGIAAFLLLVLLVGFTETRTFRDMARDFLVATADSALDAHLEIGDIDGNVFSGWRIDDVRLLRRGSPLVTAHSVILRYNLFRLPLHTIGISELTVDRPRVAVERMADGDWNLDHLVRDTTASEPSGPFTWRILIRAVRIVGGELTVRDSAAASGSSPNVFDPHFLHITDINLDASADIAPDRKSVALNAFSFTNRTGSVSIENVAGDLVALADRASVRGFSVQTERSKLRFDASLFGMNPLERFTFEQFRRTHIDLVLDAPAVDLRDLQYFLPALDFLGSRPSLSLEAHGSLDWLNLDRLVLTAERSTVDFTGVLTDIPAGANMGIDVGTAGSALHGGDLQRILPGIPLPDYSGAGLLRCSTLRFKGTPLRFTADIDGTSDAGDVKGSCALDLTQEELAYDARVVTHAIDLAKIFGPAAPVTRLNVSGTIAGSGTSFGRAHLDANLRVDSSTYRRYRAHALDATLAVRPDSLIANVRGDFEDSRIRLAGSMRLRGDSVTGFALDASADRFNLGTFLGTDTARTVLSFDASATGDGLALGAASIDSRIRLAPSTIRGFDFDADTLAFALDQHAAHARRLRVRSRLFTLSMDGRFDLPRFAALLSAEGDSLSSGIDAFRGIARGDAAPAPPARTRIRARPPSGTARVRPASPDTVAFMDADFTVAIRRPQRLLRLFTDARFLVWGEVTGHIAGGWGGWGVDARLSPSAMFYQDRTHSLGIETVEAAVRVSDLTPGIDLSRLRIDARAQVGRLTWNTTAVDTVALAISMRDRAIHTELDTRVAHSLGLSLAASSRFDRGRLLTDISALRARWESEEWTQSGDVRVEFDSAGVRVPAFGLARNGTRIALNGTRTFAGDNRFSVTVSDLFAGDVEYLATGNPADIRGNGFTGTADVDVNILGPDTALTFAAEIQVDDLGYQDARFGALYAEARYEKRALELYAKLDYRDAEGGTRDVFFASGTLPVAIGAGSAKATGEAHLRVLMKRFPLALVERFVGIFSPLTGTAEADLTIEGTPSDPRYTGYLRIDDARGVLRYNNMEYAMALSLEPRDQRINLSRLTVRNNEKEYDEGLLTATGWIDTEHFGISRVDVTMNGRLKILRAASRAVTHAMYGDLYVETGAEGLHYSGRIDRSTLLGNIRILEGDVTLPQENQQNGVSRFATITYRDIDDLPKDTTSRPSRRLPMLIRALAARDTADQASVAAAPTGLGGLVYDLTVSTEGSLRIVMPMSANAQEKLEAKLTIRNLKLDNWGGTGKFVGDVALGDGSSYHMFGKEFEAAGTLHFLGDPQNPDLDLRATYWNYHTDPVTDERRKVFVIITITGSRKHPELKWDMRWDAPDNPARPRGGDMQSDAFSFIVFGAFTDELTGSENRSKIFDQAGAIGEAMLSSSASSAANEFINKLGLQDVVKRVDVGGIGTQDARVKVTSEFSRVLFTYDGKINNLGSSDVSFEFPLNALFPSFGFGNMVIQAARRMSDSGFETTASTQESATYELKFLYRFTW